MSLEKNIKYARLLDFYGNLLSKTQLAVMEDYLNNDITLSEVAENRNITRQAVKDMVSKVEKKLDEYEEKLGFLKKISALEAEIQKLKKEL